MGGNSSKHEEDVSVLDMSFKSLAEFHEPLSEEYNQSLLDIKNFTNGCIDTGRVIFIAQNSTECLTETLLDIRYWSEVFSGTPAWRWAINLIYFIVFIFGLMGNSLVILALWKNKSMRTVTNYYILNLAIADFMVILVCLPPTVVYDLTYSWFLGEIGCKLIKYL